MAATEIPPNDVAYAKIGNKSIKTAESKKTLKQAKMSSFTKIPPGKNNGINSRKKILRYKGF